MGGLEIPSPPHCPVIFGGLGGTEASTVVSGVVVVLTRGRGAPTRAC